MSRFVTREKISIAYYEHKNKQIIYVFVLLEIHADESYTIIIFQLSSFIVRIASLLITFNRRQFII